MFSMPDQDLSPAQVVQLTKAMLSVACVDGIQPAEAALITRAMRGALDVLDMNGYDRVPYHLKHLTRPFYSYCLKHAHGKLQRLKHRQHLVVA